MDNSMDITIHGGDNSMNSLSFLWIAEFENDSIYQIENGIEHRFQEVIDRFNELKYFHLYHKEKELHFVVDLTLGTITCNEKAQVGLKEKKNIRLIYFRRHKKELSESFKEISHTIEYHLGFQYNDNLGNNRQIVLVIDSEGNWILGE